MRPFSVFNVLGLVFLGVSIILTYIFGIKPMKKGDRCSEKTEGTVIGPSIYKYDDIRIPSVEYFVDGQRYKVAGPLFKSVVTKNIRTPFGSPVTEFESNLTTKDDLPDTLVINSRGNAFVTVTKSPLMKLFPVGTKVTVYYNPNKPKESYVIRYFPPHAFFRYILYAAVAFCVIINILIIVV